VVAKLGAVLCAACAPIAENAIGAAMAARATKAINVSVNFDLIRSFIQVSPHLNKIVVIPTSK
jgi:hypothetical protein